MTITTLCDAVFTALESPNDDFLNGVLEVFRKVEIRYTIIIAEGDESKVKKLLKKVREILVILSLFSVECKVPMFDKRSYYALVNDFLVIYLNLKKALFKDEQNTKFISEILREITLVLGKGEEPTVWQVIAKSCAFDKKPFFEKLVELSFQKTKKTVYSFEQYISMIWVLYKYSQSQQSCLKSCSMLGGVSKFKPPAGLVRWLCHHFTGYGWKGLTDKEIHSKLITESQPKGFLLALEQKVTGRAIEEENDRGDMPFTNGFPETERNLEDRAVDNDSEDEQTERSNSPLNPAKSKSESGDKTDTCTGEKVAEKLMLNGEVKCDTVKENVSEDFVAAKRRKIWERSEDSLEFSIALKSFYKGANRVQPVIVLKQFSLSSDSDLDMSTNDLQHMTHRTRSKAKSS